MHLTRSSTLACLDWTNHGFAMRAKSNGFTQWPTEHAVQLQLNGMARSDCNHLDYILARILFDSQFWNRMRSKRLATHSVDAIKYYFRFQFHSMTALWRIISCPMRSILCTYSNCSTYPNGSYSASMHQWPTKCKATAAATTPDWMNTRVQRSRDANMHVVIAFDFRFSRSSFFLSHLTPIPL